MTMTKNNEEQAAPLVMRGVCKRYGWPRSRAQTVLDGVDLKVPRGAVAVLLGANGVGKSALLKIAYGRCSPEAGEVRVFGLDPFRQVDEVLRRVGVVPDAPDAPGWRLAVLGRVRSGSGADRRGRPGVLGVS